MRFALLGDHPDGRATAAALVASGRHELTTTLEHVAIVGGLLLLALLYFPSVDD